MKITRISCMDDGTSSFDEVEIDMTSSGEISSLSKPYPASSIVFQETPPGADSGWHVSPHRQYMILLHGEIEIEVGMGDKRRFHGGDILLLEDTWGSGHPTRTIGGKVHRSILIQLDA